MDNKFGGIDEGLKKLQERIGGLVFVLGFLLVAGSALRMHEKISLGNVLFDVFIFIFFSLLTLLKNRISPRRMLMSICAGITAVAFKNFTLMGLNSLGFIMIAASVSIIGVVFGFKKAVIVMSVSAVITAFIGFLHGTGVLTGTEYLADYLSSPFAWGSQILAFIVFTYAILIVIDIVQTSLLESRSELSVKNNILSENEQRLRFITDNAKDVIICHDLKERILFVSSSVEEMFGYTPDEVYSMKLRDLSVTESFNKTSEDFLYYFESAENGASPDIPLMEHEYRRKDGSTFWGELKISVMHDSKGNYVGNQGIIRDISVRKQEEENLKLAKELAEKANTAKTDFLANMSHELRTPLTVILGMTEFYFHENSGKMSKEDRNVFERVFRNGKYMLRMINDLLDFRTIESDNIVLDIVPVNLADVARESVSMVSEIFNDKPVKAIVKTRNPASFIIYTDRDRLRQIMVNIIHNAFKFTQKGYVAIEIYPPEGGAISFSIADSGIGIPPERIPEIFNKFSQLDPGYGRKYGGAGIGLNIAHMLAGKLGGAISVKSSPGKGSVFTVSLPLKTKVTG
ncbi:MAG: PAS domain-containing sensor histidine kinase [Fibrobacterota bacterium]